MGYKKFISIFFLIILLVGCGKQEVSIPENPEQENGENVNTGDENEDSTEDEDGGDETGDGDKEEESVFTGLTISHITDHSAVFTVNVVDGYRYITEKGVIWSDDESLPESNRSSDKRDPEFFSYKGCIINLEKDKDYYIRPYMIMNGDSVYGEIVKFTTLNSLDAVLPKGKITWEYVGPPESYIDLIPKEELANAEKWITASMDSAVCLYNIYVSVEKHLQVRYNPIDVPTADGGINGFIRFGEYRGNRLSVRTAMHEIAHTLGVGTTNSWKNMIENNEFVSPNVKREYVMIRTIEDFKEFSMLRGATPHFWPYGLNYDKDVKDERDLVKHALLVNAMKADGM